MYSLNWSFALLFRLTLYKSHGVRTFTLEKDSVTIECSWMHKYSTHDMPSYTFASTHAQTGKISIDISIDIVHFVAVDVTQVSWK